MDSERFAGILVCSGAVIGLVGMTPASSTVPFAYLGEISFVLVLLLGVLLIRKSRQGRVFAAVVLWFAMFGGAVSIAFLLLGLMLPWDGALRLGSIGLAGAALAIAGALVRLRRPS